MERGERGTGERREEKWREERGEKAGGGRRERGIGGRREEGGERGRKRVGIHHVNLTVRGRGAKRLSAH